MTLWEVGGPESKPVSPPRGCFSSLQDPRPQKHLRVVPLWAVGVAEYTVWCPWWGAGAGSQCESHLFACLGGREGSFQQAPFLICTPNSWLWLSERLIWSCTLTTGRILLWLWTAFPVELWAAHLLCLWPWTEWEAGWSCCGTLFQSTGCSSLGREPCRAPPASVSLSALRSDRSLGLQCG